MRYDIPTLPLVQDVESKAVLRASRDAHRYLAELKGAAASIPNQAMLINTLALQEAKDSSEVEAIVTTQDELYQASVLESTTHSPATKEVERYTFALHEGFVRVQQTGLIRVADILALHQQLTANRGGFRKLPGTALRSSATGEVIYEPPQDPGAIKDLMDNLVLFLNDDTSDIDPLVMMAIAHHQFESIHPFYDGNGRAGRILNILFLVARGLLDLPVLYLSRFVVQNKADYYTLLQSTRDTGEWEPWILFMLQGIAQTARDTLHTVRRIAELMLVTKHRLRDRLPKIYSQDLLNNLFRHPYTKIEFVMNELRVSRPTASRYLKELAEHGFVGEHKVGRSKYFVNEALVALLADVEARQMTAR